MGISSVNGAAFSNCNVTVIVPPVFRSSFRPISIMCKPPGFNSTEDCAGSSTGPAGRIIMVPFASIELIWISTESAESLLALTSASGLSSEFCRIMYAAELPPALPGRAQAAFADRLAVFG
jgi:hypothetical protein